MKLLKAYLQAVDEDDDPKERAEFSADEELKLFVAEEIVEAFKEITANKAKVVTGIESISPFFKCVTFWFIIGIRVGKILRDEELAAK